MFDTIESLQHFRKIRPETNTLLPVLRLYNNSKVKMESVRSNLHIQISYNTIEDDWWHTWRRHFVAMSSNSVVQWFSGSVVLPWPSESDLLASTSRLSCAVL